jgi:exodeoxyribonuclease VII large subunit
MSNRLSSALRSRVQLSRHGLAGIALRFDRASPEGRIQTESHRLLSLYKRLESASPKSVLNRGFAIVRDAKGRPVTRRAGIGSGQRVEAEFADGKVPLRSE